MSIDAKKKRSISRRMFVGDAKCLGHVFSFTQKSDGSIYAVSYTHLDVYKRQLWNTDSFFPEMT